MAQEYLSDEVAICLGKFFFAGNGPSHSEISACYADTKLTYLDKYDRETRTPNKQDRILHLCREARNLGSPRQREVLERILVMLRAHGVFGTEKEDHKNEVASLRSAFASQHLELTEQGYLSSELGIDLETGGRAALDEHLDRLSRNLEDPGVLLGVAKELLESCCKFVLEENSMLPAHKASFDELITLTFERLDLLAANVDVGQPGGKQIRAIYQSARTTALQINELRNLQGTGHGRTLPTGVTLQAGRYVIREATHVAELILSTHDRMRGRS